MSDYVKLRSVCPVTFRMSSYVTIRSGVSCRPIPTWARRPAELLYSSALRTKPSKRVGFCLERV